MRRDYKQTQVGVVPADWNCATVAKIAGNTKNSIVGGPFGSDLVSSDYVSRGVPVVRGQNMGAGYVSGDFVFVSKPKAKRLQANTARAGDLVFTQRGTLGQVSIVPSDPFDEYIISQSQMKLTLNPALADTQYIYQYFSSVDGQRQITESAIQTGVPHTNLGILKAYKIPLPSSVAEQRAIAAALSDVDALLGGLARLIAKKRDLKQAVMQQLLTGQTRLPGFSGEWEDVEFGHIACIRNTKVIVSSTPAGTQCVELDAISQETGRLLTSTEATGDSSKYSFKSGDVLFGRLRAYLRKYWLATFDGICSTEIWPLISRDERLCSGFLHLLVQTNEFVNAAGVSYGTHMPRSDWSVLKKSAVRLPSPAEQTAIATVLSDMDAELSALETRCDKTRALKQAMMQELLTGRVRLISGELKVESG